MVPVGGTSGNSSESAATARDELRRVLTGRGWTRRDATHWRIMPSDFRRALFPLLILTRLFGFEVFEYPAGRLWPQLTVLYSGLFCSTSVLALIGVRSFMQDTTSLTSVTGIIYLLSVALCFLSAWFMARNVEIYRKCLVDIAVLDDTLETLGSAKDYRKLRKNLIKVVLAWFFACSMLYAWSALYQIQYHHASPYLLLLCYFLNYAVYATSIVPMQYYILLRYAASRFDCIYELIEGTLANDQIRIGSFWEARSQSRSRVTPQEEERQRILWTSMHAYLKLCDILHKLNKVFEVQICLGIIFCFWYTLYCFLFAYAQVLTWNQDRIGKWHNGLAIAILGTTQLLKSVTPNHICEVVSSKAAGIKRIAERVLVLAKDPMRKDLSIFLLRAYHRPLRLSAMGLFDFGYEFVYQFFASSMAALVIMLQLNSFTSSWN